jgi:hypothetical protein
MWINFAEAVKNFHNLKLSMDLKIGLAKWREIGWGGNWSLIGNVKC